MTKLLSLVLFAACAGRAPAPLTSVSPPAPARAPGYELLPLDHTGELTRQVWIEKRYVSVGIAQRAKNDARVVIVDGSRHRVVFTPPLQIPGLPADARGFDYFLSPAVEDDGGVFRLSAAASSPSTIYTVTWKLTWSSLRSTFEVSAPEITSRPVGECLTCDAG